MSPRKNTSPKAAETNVVLEIQGDRRNGYNLVMSPEGFFTADYHYETEQEAIAAAKELFGVGAEDWIKV